MKLNDKFIIIFDVFVILRSLKEWYCVDFFVFFKYVMCGCQFYKLKLEQIFFVIVYEGRDYEVFEVKNNVYGLRYLIELIFIVLVFRLLEMSG